MGKSEILKMGVINKEVSHFLWKLKFDLLLLLASGFFFSLFIHGSLQIEKMSGLRAKVGVLAGGVTDRKEYNAKNFIKVGVGTNFHNMDSVWVGKKGSALIKLESGNTLELSEMTLLLLKRRFKMTASIASPAEQEFTVAKGKVILNGKKIDSVPAEKSSTFQAPEQAVKGSVALESTKKIYPPEQGTIYTRSETTVEIIFAWPEAHSGHLAIRDNQDGHTIFQELSHQRSTVVHLKQGRAYSWQLLGDNSLVKYGPFQFELKLLVSNKEAQDLLKNNSSTRPIEVYW